MITLEKPVINSKKGHSFENIEEKIEKLLNRFIKIYKK